MKIAFDWGVSSYYGWGVYGLNMALEWSKRPDVEARCAQVVRLDHLHIDKLRLSRIKPFIARSNAQQPRELWSDYVLLRNLGNECLGYPHEPGGIGVVFFEEPLSPQAVERAKRYDIIITGSTWNEEILRSHGLSSVTTLIQGVDRSLFHPALRRNLYPGRFLIFSGGKAEPRKGQDIVVKAFRIFARKHPEAMLVTAWHSPWPHLRNGMDLDLSEFADRVIDVGAVPNGQMAPVYRECHVGLFPNRAEGGTNLVAMEAIACGVPAIITASTGHIDLVRLAPQCVWPLDRFADGEPDLDQVIEGLETAFDGGLNAGPHKLPGWDHTADGLIAAATKVKGNL